MIDSKKLRDKHTGLHFNLVKTYSTPKGKKMRQVDISKTFEYWHELCYM